MALVYERIKDFKLDNNMPVKLKTMGNVQEISFSQFKNKFCSIRLIDKDHYVRVNYSTGEISDLYLCNHIKDRSESLFQVSQSLKRLRDLINSNVIDTNEWLWITLTYKKNMRDTKQLYKDFQKFIQKFRYKFSKYKIEYIVACEPQARGAWHMHCLIGFGTTAPYISNDVIWELWSPQGIKVKEDFTKTKSLNDIDNVGAYLTAYLGDIELNEENISSLAKSSPKMAKMALNNEITINEKQVDGTSKRFIKGARLYLYPPKFNLYRYSRGCKKPIIEDMDYIDAKKRVGLLQKPTYETCIKIEDSDTHFHNTYFYEYYNKLRK